MKAINKLKTLEKLEQALKENTQTIEELIKIDSKYCKTKIAVDQLIEVIQKLKTESEDQQQEQQKQKIKIIYNGNPCITLNLCILAIQTQNTIILDYEGNMRGLNSFIIQTVNNLLTDKLIHNLPNEETPTEKTIFIDDINKYNSDVSKSKLNIKFYSHNYIDFYSDSDEYEEISELIYKYAEENQIPMEVYSELETTQAIQMMKKGLGKIAVILTSNEETKKECQTLLKDKELYINKNPFKENIRIIKKEIFNM